MMNDVLGGSPPLFSMSDSPTLRRVKPLPKRRRTSDGGSQDGSQGGNFPSTPPADSPIGDPMLSLSSSPPGFPMPPYYYSLLGSGGTGGGLHDVYTKGGEPAIRTPGSVDFHSAYRHVGVVPGTTSDEEEHNDGDYIDHLQHPSNTKKRKVPAAHNFPPESTNGASEPPPSAGGIGGNESIHDIVAAEIIASRLSARIGEADSSDIGVAMPTTARKSRTSPAALAGLKLKEMLKSRKRQLATVLGAISHGDTLVLDQALSARLPWFGRSSASSATTTEKPRGRNRNRRLSKPSASRQSSGLSTKSASASSATLRLPETEFTFVCHSTSE